MSVVFNNIRSYWLALVSLSLLVCSCSETTRIPEESQGLNRELFNVFLKTNFGAELELPKGVVLKNYDKTHYRWRLKKEKRVKMSFTDNPDFKATVFDPQDSQLHLVFCKLGSNMPICDAIDSLNRVVWELDDVQDSLLVDRTEVSTGNFEGKWFLNSKTIGGNCRGKIWETKKAKLLVYYMTKEYNDDKKEMSALGDSVLNTIDFF